MFPSPTETKTFNLRNEDWFLILPTIPNFKGQRFLPSGYTDYSLCYGNTANSCDDEWSGQSYRRKSIH